MSFLPLELLQPPKGPGQKELEEVGFPRMPEQVVGPIWRLGVPGGWLVWHESGGVCFVPNEVWTWKLEPVKFG